MVFCSREYTKQHCSVVYFDNKFGTIQYFVPLQQVAYACVIIIIIMIIKIIIMIIIMIIIIIKNINGMITLLFTRIKSTRYSKLFDSIKT